MVIVGREQRGDVELPLSRGLEGRSAQRLTLNLMMLTVGMMVMLVKTLLLSQLLRTVVVMVRTPDSGYRLRRYRRTDLKMQNDGNLCSLILNERRISI